MHLSQLHQRKMQFFPLVFASYLLVLLPSLARSLNSDGLSLLALKAAITTDPDHVLRTWSESDSAPCKWLGITCVHGRVAELYLPNKRLNGYIPSELGALVSLRRLSFSHNNFTKLIPSHLFNATSLVYLDLSNNSLTGPIPEQIKTLKTLVHLDLSSNLLNGSLPEGLSELPNLGGNLNLSNNRLSGEIPASFGEFPMTLSLDLRHNNLTGKIPQTGSLLNQGPTAFSENPNLCGFPLKTPCPDTENPRIPIKPVNPKSPTGYFPKGADPEQQHSEKARGINGAIAITIISCISVIVGAVSVSAWLLRNKWRSGEGEMGKERFDEVENDEEQKGKFVVLGEGFGLELEDLLRASAYVVGKSRSGIVYKVVVGRGSGAPPAVVAVRRLSESGEIGRFKEFESEVEAIDRVRHPNIVRLRAYYYANDEKLLVSDYFPNGSLYAALHGGPLNSLQPLTWAARLNIAQGLARGLTYIHECSPRKYFHGSIKSSKILLDNDLEPYIAGFGVARLVSGTFKLGEPAPKKQGSTQRVVAPAIGGSKTAASSSAYYSAPEARASGSGRLTQKCDVYSFGIVLLEALTGRLPDAGSEENDGLGLESFVRKAFCEERPLSEIIDSALLGEVYAKKQVLAAFHIALSCTEGDPDIRPRMRAVSESLDRLRSR